LAPVLRVTLERCVDRRMHCSGLGCAHGQKQQQGIVGRPDEAEAQILPGCLLVQGIDEQADSTALSGNAPRPVHGIDQKDFPQAFSLSIASDGEATEARTGDATWESFLPGRRQVAIIDLRRRQCMIAVDAGRPSITAAKVLDSPLS
jgi:hypothetical protein